MSRLLAILVGVLVFAGLHSCKDSSPANAGELPSISYAPYISAFSSGLVGSRDPIRVELTYVVDQAVVDSAALPSLLRISPSVKGELKWAKRSVLAFYPSEALKQDQLYTAVLDLAALRPDVPDSLRRFSFQFSAIPQGLQLESMQLRPDPIDDSPTKRQIAGSLITYDYAEAEVVETLLSATQAGKELPVSWVHANRGREHEFVIDGVARGVDDSSVEVRVRGKALGVSTDTTSIVLVPNVNTFSITGIEIEQGADQVATLFFSDPLSLKQDITGLVHFADGSDVRLVKQGNTVLAYPTERRTGALELVVEPNIENSAGGKLGTAQRFPVTFLELKPEIKLVGEGTISPASQGATIPFQAVALSSVNVEVVRIYTENIPQFFQDNNLDSWSRLTRVGRPVYRGTVPLRANGPIDYLAWNYFAIDINELVKVEPGAIYHVVLSFDAGNSRYPCEEAIEAPLAFDDAQAQFAEFNELSYYSSYENDYYYREEEGNDPCNKEYYYGRKVSRNFLASNIGLMAKGADAGEMLVVATDLTTAKPISGLEIELINIQQQVMASAKTAPNGVAVFNPDYQPFLAIAKRGTERAYLSLENGQALSTSSFDVSGERTSSGTKGMIYGERGVWRPGDSIYLTLLLERGHDEQKASAPVIFEFYNPNGQLVEQRAVAERVPGMYSLRTATHPDAPTGPWNAVVRTGATSISQTVRIETVMPNRLKVELDFAGNPVPLYKDENMSLTARWLHGAKAGALKADVIYSAYTANPGFAKDDTKLNGYSFHDDSKAFSISDQMIFDGNLSADGAADISLDIENLEELPGMIQARFTTRVFEQTGAFSTIVESALLSPYESYVGIRAPESKSYYGLNASEPQTFDIVVRDDRGKPVNREVLDVEIYDIDWSYWWERRGGNSLASYVANKAQHIAIEDKASAKGGKGSYTANLSKLSYGRKMMRVIDRVSGHSSSLIFYVEDPQWAYDPGSRPGGAELLAFNLDKEEYTIGESIKVALPAFPGGRAFVTVENGERLLSYRWVDGRETPQDILLSTEANMAPNAYVHVTLIQPHAQTANDQPIRLYGVQPFKLTDPMRKLTPKLDLPKELAPEEKFTVKVSEKDGRAMSYTLAIVEEGLLDITSFDTPDPYERFNKRTALGVRTWDLYRYVLGAFSGKLAGLLAIGGDEDAGKEADPRANRFRPVVKFVGPFQLKAGATASHTFEMPNYIGSVRAMVISSKNGAYGSAEATRPVKRPLMVLATLPRVLGPGETVDLPVTVFAMDEKIRSVDIKLEGLELLETSTNAQVLRFSESGEQIARFRVKVPEKLGVARVRVVATGAGFSASDEIEIQVRAPNPEVTEVKNAVLEPGEAWSTEYLGLGMEGTNTGKLEVSASMPINLEHRLGYLTRYPHGCLEQTVSAAFPQLYLDDLEKLDENRAAMVQRNVNAAIRKLESFSIGDGRYSYWPGQRSNYAAWATSYAGHFMLEAQDKGYRVPANTLGRWQTAQKRDANAWSPERRTNYAAELPLTQAYRLFTLARSGAPQIGAMNRLKGYNKLDASAAELLAAAYALAGQRDAARDLLAKKYKDELTEAQERWTYGSQVRDLGISLFVQTILGDRTKAFKLANEISASLSSERWLSTQTTAWSLMAMSKFLKEDDKTKPLAYTYSIRGNEKSQTQGELIRVINLEAPTTLPKRFEIKNTGERRMYVRVISTGIPSTIQYGKEESNLQLSVRYTDLGGKEINVESLVQGQDFLAITTVRHPGTLDAYHDLAYTQIFPSGWEIRNQRLEGAGLPKGIDYQDIRDDRVLSYFGLNRNQSLTITTQLNAAYTGSYYLSDRYVQAMYDRDIRARLPGRWVEVN